MSITRTNPFQPTLPPDVRVSDSPTSPVPPTTGPGEDPAARASGGPDAARPGGSRRDRRGGEPARAPAGRAADAAVGGRARPFYRREPGLATMLGSAAVGLAAFLGPDALQRAAGLSAVGLLLVGIGLLVFLPSSAKAGAAARPLYRREPWLVALYVAFSVGLSAAVVPAALQWVVILVSMSFLVLGLVLLVRPRPGAAAGAGEGRGDGGTE